MSLPGPRGRDTGIHFLFPHSLESPGVPRLPPKPLLPRGPLATSVFYTHFPWWGPQSGSTSSPSPPPTPFYLPFSSSSWSSSMQKETLRQEQLQKALSAPPLHPPSRFSRQPCLTPHSCRSQQPALPSADTSPLQCLTNLYHLASWCPQVSAGPCPWTWSSSISAPGRTARSCHTPLRAAVWGNASGRTNLPDGFEIHPGPAFLLYRVRQGHPGRPLRRLFVHTPPLCPKWVLRLGS